MIDRNRKTIPDPGSNGRLREPEEGQYSSFERELNQSLEIFEFSIPLPEKTKGKWRIFYNNINGIEINSTVGTYIKQQRDKQTYNYIKDINAPTKLDGLIRQQKLWDVDIAAVTEMCTAWEEVVPRRVVQQITKRYEKNACWTVSSSQLRIGTSCKPGGTGILSMGCANGRIQDRGTDPWNMGRWTYVLYSCSSTGPGLLLITGYRPGKRSLPGGPKTAWAQQTTILLKAGRDLSPEVAFLEDMKSWLLQYRKPRMEVLICLDANELWTEEAAIKSFATSLDLRNANQILGLKATHPNITKASNSTTIDFCLCSENLLQYITYAASAPYDLEVLGDHRGILLDIDMYKLFKEEIVHEDIKTRKLVMSQPKVVEKYLSEVDNRFIKQNIYQRCQQLMKKAIQGSPQNVGILDLYNKLDREIYGICQKAERRCRPEWAGKYAWSPELAKAIKVVNYWRYRWKHPGEMTGIHYRGREVNIPYVPLSHVTIHQFLNDSKKNLRDVQMKARELRQHHLEELATQYAAQNNLSTQQAILELMSHEETRGMFRMLRNQIKQEDRRNIMVLWESVDEMGNFTKRDDTKVVHTNGPEIHHALLRRNEEHLNQAHRTPFAQGKLKKGLQWDGTGQLSDNMLTGEILQQRRFNSAMQLYLESIRVRDLSQLGVIKPILPLEEYKQFWKKKRETTVTSPYGLHVGHYKAATLHPKILNVHRLLLLIPFQTGLVPTRWRRTVQTMIEKEPGAPWIHRLRIIELFDAQANAGFQIFIGRKLMHHAVKQSLLSAESFGSTPGKMASAAVLQKVLAIDQLRVERRAGGIFDCDASGCYDRILPPLASVHLQALGLQKQVGTLLARLMYKAKRHVRTGHGISKQNMQTKRKKVLYGIGQGNGGGPAIWIAHLTVMFTAISSVCLGFVMNCVQAINQVTTVGTGYVDDVTLGLSLPHDTEQTENMVFKHIKKMSQLWERLLYITGGRLELTKCFWIPITWKWSGGKPVMVTKVRRSKQLFLRESETGELIQIPRKTGKEAEKRLGVSSSCDGKWSVEYIKWLNFSTEFGRKVKYSHLNRMSGYLAYHSLWLAKFRYSAPVLGLTTTQLKKIQQRIIGPCLSVSGYNNKIPRAVVYGPESMGGMNWKNINVVSLYEKLKLLIGSIRLQDKLGQMLEIQLSWLQLFAGTSVQLLMENKYIPYLPMGWFKHLHKQLVENEICVARWGGWTPTTQRENDRVIMDMVRKQTPEWTWAGINRCRIFLKATTITDITTIDGTYIPIKVREVQSKIRDSRIRFPLQKRPSKEDMRHWNYFIESLSVQGTLHVPLGNWTRDPDQLFAYFYNPMTDILYKRRQHGWAVYGRRTGKQTRRYVKLQLGVSTLPTPRVPTRVIEGSNYLIRLQTEDREIQRISMPRSKEQIHQSSVEARILGKYTLDEEGLTLIKQQWHTGTCKLIGATDGGLKNKIGSSSYAIYAPDNTQPVIEGYAGEAQVNSSASSTRQELLGQLAIEIWMDKLYQRWGPPQCRITLVVVTDSKSSIEILQNMSQIRGIADTLRPETDVALEIARYQKNSYWITRDVVKVESHIDKERAPNIFFWECNERADTLATQARDEFRLEELLKQEALVFRGTKAVCHINGTLVNNNLFSSLTEHIQGKILKDYLVQKYGWTDQIFSRIAWDEHEKELHKYPYTQKVTLIKFIHGWMATNKRKYREGTVAFDGCPLCGEKDSSIHFVYCNDPKLKLLRTGRWQKYMEDMLKDTDQNGGRQVFQAGIMTLQGHSYPTDSEKQQWPPALQTAFKDQTDIGWEQILYGRIAKSWKKVANTEDTDRCEGTSDPWVRKIIRINWKLGLDLWSFRNELIHGTEGPAMRTASTQTTELVRDMYLHLRPKVERGKEILFPTGTCHFEHQSYQSQLAWLEQIRFLYPAEYKETEHITVERLRIEREVRRAMENGINRG